MSDLVRVAVDAMGGDYAPVEPVKGAVEAVNADERVKVQLVGQTIPHCNAILIYYFYYYQ